MALFLKVCYNFVMDFLRAHQLNIMLFLIGVCSVLAVLTSFTKTLTEKRKFELIALEVTAALLLTMDRFAYIYRGDVSSLGWWMVRISNFCVYLFGYAMIFFYTMYTKDLYMHEGGMKKTPVILDVIYVISYILVILLVISLFTGLFYTFDAQNRYQRNWGIYITYILSLASLVMILVFIIHHKKNLRPKLWWTVLLFAVLPIIATALQLAFYGLSLQNITLVFNVILVHIFSLLDLNEEIEKAHNLEVEILERYKVKLEKTVDERTRELITANKKAENLLLNILPADVAKELTEHPDHTIAKEYPNATVLFTDIVDFTKMSGKMTAEETVSMLNRLTSLFDERAKREGIEKIKTIGDAYMAATGLSDNTTNTAAVDMIKFAQGLLEDVQEFNRTSDVKIRIRIGINTGNLVAGVIGKTKFIYDIWGDTVNVASRMESTGEAMRIHLTESTREQTEEFFNCQESVEMEIKGKGLMKTYFL